MFSNPQPSQLLNKVPTLSGIASIGAKGGQSAPLTAKKLSKIRKKREKERKNWKKEGKIGKKSSRKHRKKSRKRGKSGRPRTYPHSKQELYSVPYFSC